MRQVPPLRGLAVVILAVAMAVLLPLGAEARAGGGHSTGGGSHSSGGSSHSSGGSSHSSGGGGGGGGGGFYTGPTNPVAYVGGYPVPWMVPVGGVGVLILLLVLWMYMRQRQAVGVAGDGYVDSTEPARAAAAAANASYGLTAMKAEDPKFEETAFLERAARTFLLAQQAWSDRNLVAVRPLMGQGTYLSWESQIHQMARRHEKDVMEEVAIKGATIVRAVNGPYDHITVRFEASAVDYTVDDRTGHVLTGDKKAAPFVEYWTFERSGRTPTLEKEGVLEQKCPNCGGPLNVNAIGECTYCRAAITNGTYDWVLQRIDQADYWQSS